MNTGSEIPDVESTVRILDGKNESRESLKKFFDIAVKNAMDKAMQQATQELMEEQKKAIQQIVDEYKATLRQIVEEEKKNIWEKAEELRNSILKLGL
jgi:molecular chaperone DnaK (HSP70)